MPDLWPEPVPGHPTPGMNVWGWMRPSELEWLFAAAKTMDSCAEVGVLHGRSATALLKGCPGPVWCIDPWDDPEDKCYASFLRNCGQYENLRAVRGLSPAVIKSSLLPDVDMTFLDGAHDRASVEADIRAWLPKTRKLLCGHDYNDEIYPDVRAVVDEIFGETVRVAPDTTIWAVQL